MNSIGTRTESTLHRELKRLYGRGGEVEVELDGYICDARNARGELVEIQTGTFAPLKKKLTFLSVHVPVRLVHPVIAVKTLELFSTQGELLSRRKSPRKGSCWNLFDQLIYAPELAELPNIVIEVLLLDAVERRIDDGKGSWRRRGISIADRIPLSIGESLEFSGPADYRNLLPFRRREEFSSAALAERAGIMKALARKALYVLLRIGVLKRIRREGRSWVYMVRERLNR